jgi:hypothetical protein
MMNFLSRPSKFVIHNYAAAIILAVIGSLEEKYSSICQTDAASPAEPWLLPTLDTVGIFLPVKPGMP